MTKASEEIVSGTGLAPVVGYLGPESPTFGVHGKHGTAIGFGDDVLDKHVLFLGGIGQGKTNGMFGLVDSVRAAMREDDVIVFFDTKGDWYERYYRDGDAVIARSSAAALPGQVVWNLFEELQAAPDGVEIADEVHELAGTIFDGIAAAAGDNNRIWSNMGRDVFAALVTAMHRSATRPGSTARATNASIRAITDTMTLDDMRAWLKPHRDLRGATSYIARDDSNTTRSVLVFLHQAIGESFRSSFGARGDFSIRRFLRAKGKRALFLEYDIASGETLAPIYRTMLDLAIKEALSRRRADGRVFFVLDEFALLPKLNHLSNGLNFGRSLGLRFIVGAQNVRQVQDKYGDHMAASVMSAFGTVFAFRLFDGDSRAFVRDRFGTNRKLLRFDAAVRAKGLLEEIVEGHVVEDWDLSGLPVGACIAALPNTSPLWFEFRHAP